MGRRGGSGGGSAGGSRSGGRDSVSYTRIEPSFLRAMRQQVHERSTAVTVEKAMSEETTREHMQLMEREGFKVYEDEDEDEDKEGKKRAGVEVRRKEEEEVMKKAAKRKATERKIWKGGNAVGGGIEKSKPKRNVVAASYTKKNVNKLSFREGESDSESDSE